MLNIVLLEEDRLELKLLREDLKKAFLHSNIVTFRSVGDFLIAAPFLPKEYILVTELDLPLLQCGKNLEEQEEMENLCEYLLEAFPRTLRDWDDLRSGERVIRFLRNSRRHLNPRFKVPVIVYTHSRESSMSKNIASDSNVFYCNKREPRRTQHLVEVINRLSPSAETSVRLSFA